jgi:hypothetical protein
MNPLFITAFARGLATLATTGITKGARIVAPRPIARPVMIFLPPRVFSMSSKSAIFASLVLTYCTTVSHKQKLHLLYINLVMIRVYEKV